MENLGNSSGISSWDPLKLPRVGHHSGRSASPGFRDTEGMHHVQTMSTAHSARSPFLAVFSTEESV